MSAARIAGKKSITVKLSDTQIAANGDKLQRQGGKWVIVKESTGS